MKLLIPLIILILYCSKVELAQEHDVDHSKSSSPERVLSRKRRFFIPQTDGWIFKLKVGGSIPIEGLGSGLNGLQFELPFTYVVDSGTIVGRS